MLCSSRWCLPLACLLILSGVASAQEEKRSGETKESAPAIVATYKAAGKPNLTFFAGKPAEKNGAVVAYLLEK